MESGNIKDDVFEMVNKKKLYNEISNYIENRFYLNLGAEELNNIAKYLVERFKYTREDVLNGRADEIITNYIRDYNLRNNSLGNNDVNKRPLRSKVVKKDSEKFKKLLIGFVGTAAIMAVGNFAIGELKDFNNELEARKDLGNSVATEESYFYNANQSIVAQSTLRTNGNVGYNVDGIAQDIIKIAQNNPNDVDVILHNVYFDLDFNALKNMDRIFTYLNMYIEKDSALQTIFSNVSSSYFLDYLVSGNYVLEDDKNYGNIINAVNNYKESSTMSDNAFNELSKRDQKYIKELIDNFDKQGKIMYENLQIADNIGGR